MDLRKTDPGPRFVLDGRLLHEEMRVIDTKLPQYEAPPCPTCQYCVRVTHES